MDVAFPNGDEDKFSEMAIKFGSKLMFVYEDPDRIRSDCSGVVLGKSNKTGKAELVFSRNPSREEFNRNIDVAFSFETSKKSDFLHHRNSGLNHILAKLLSEKDTIVAFSFNDVLNDRHGTVLGRMRQNVKLCRKAKVKMIVASFAKSPYELKSEIDLKSFASSIGMNTKEIKESFSVIEGRILRNRKKKAGKLPAEGVEILD